MGFGPGGLCPGLMSVSPVDDKERKERSHRKALIPAKNAVSHKTYAFPWYGA